MIKIIVAALFFVSSVLAVSPCNVSAVYPFQSGRIFKECTDEQARSTTPQQFGEAFRACNRAESSGPQTCNSIPFLFDCGFDLCGGSSRVYVSGGLTNPPREANAPVYIARGRQYMFANYAGINHPMAIHNNFQTLPTTDRYNNGVSNQGTVDPNVPLTINVQAGAPDQLAYQCENHQSMSGRIEVGDAVMDPFQQTGNVLGSATGAISCTVHQTTNVVTWNIRWKGIVTVNAMHFHAPGGPNTDAPVIIDVGAQCANANPCVTTDFVSDATNIGHLLSGQAYINLHTTAYPGGEIRANVICRDVTLGPVTSSPTPGPTMAQSAGSVVTTTLFTTIALVILAISF